jgi:hypothetical protein
MGYCSFESNATNLRRIFYALLLIYFLYFFYDIFFADSRSLWTLFAILLIIVPFLFEGYSGMYFPWKIKTIIVLSLLLHTIGEVHRWYYDLPHYDKISHLISSVAIGYLVFLFIILIGLYYGLGWTRFKAIIFIIFLTMAFAFFWEWWELFSDSYFGSKFFWDIRDGFGDALINLSGAIFVAWDANKYLKESTWTEVAGDFIRTGRTRPYRMRWEIRPLPENLGVLGTAERSPCKDGKKTSRFASSNEECGSCGKTE